MRLGITIPITDSEKIRTGWSKPDPEVRSVPLKHTDGADAYCDIYLESLPHIDILARIELDAVVRRESQSGCDTLWRVCRFFQCEDNVDVNHDRNDC